MAYFASSRRGITHDFSGRTGVALEMFAVRRREVLVHRRPCSCGHGDHGATGEIAPDLDAHLAGLGIGLIPGHGSALY